MSSTTASAPIYLTVLPQPGGLAAALTDLGALARVETIAIDAARLAALEEAWKGRSSGAFATAVAPDPEADDGIRASTAALLRELLPPGVVALLREAAPRALTIQVDRSLAWVPWELLWDGEAWLGERFAVCRRIVGAPVMARAAREGAGRGALKVLLITAGAASVEATSRLNSVLRSMAGIAVSMVSAGDLPRHELLALIGASDVVHVVGAVDGRPAPGGSVLWWWGGEPLDIAAIAALAPSPPLLVSQDEGVVAPGRGAPANRTVAATACACGLNMLTCEPDGRVAGRQFMQQLYAALLRGMPVGAAAQAARLAVRRASGMAALAALRPELHGDGGIVVHERRTAVEDNQRQVTIVSVDLVGSTRLLGTLGAETYSDLLAQYHRRCAEIVRARGGSVDDFQGDDGAMCYFGTPVAREDAAAQALHAGLELVAAMQALGLQLRVGICTGQVVVRDGQPVGSAIHLAARLQAIAAPATVVVGESTRRIASQRFRFERLEPGILLKGFDTEQVCHRLLGAAPAAGEARALPGTPSLAPFVNRHEELRILRAHWDAARAGTLRVVRVLGEPGIGKSRLVREFRRTLAGDGHAVFDCRCSPDHASSAFHPLIEALRKELRLAASAPAGLALGRIRAMLARSGMPDEVAVALLAELLSLPLPEPHPILEQGAQRRRQLTVDLLVDLARRRLQHAPGCLVVEDAHWLDPSTAEFLERLAAATRSSPLLVVATARTDAGIAWRPRMAVYETELQGLSPPEARALVVGACGDTRLSPELVQAIASRTDGVPLFIEESARMAVEMGTDQAFQGPAALSVPATVLDLLTARLDRLGAAKQVAQVGGTIGREFPLAVLEAVLRHPQSPITGLEPAVLLGQLMRAGMLLPRDDGDGPRFVFRHALMRDAASGSLLARDRLRLHQVIADVVSHDFAELAGRQPEMVAFHFAEAGMDAEALHCWEAAVRNAAARSAHAEAIGHIGSALAVLARMPDDEARNRTELRLQLLLAGRLIATRGYGAERVGRAYARAMELARHLGDEGALQRVLLGLEGYHFMRADFGQARADVLAAAAGAGNAATPIQRVQTLWALANIRMHEGEMAEAVEDMDACRAEYLRLAHRPEAVQDPGVMCLCYSAWSLWQLGRPDEARARVVAVVAHAEEIRHRFSIGEAYGFHAAVLHFRGEDRAALASAAQAVRICEENGFAVWLAHARVMRGRIAAELGQVADGVEEMRQGLAAWTDSGAVVTTPFYLTMRAEGHALEGRPEAGLALLEQALELVERTGERYYEAEIRRLTGRLTLESARRAGLDRGAEALDWLHQALACARARRLGSLELRAAMDLAALWQAQGRHEAAIATLAPACDAVVGGTGTRDVLQAQALLAALRAPAKVD